MNSDLIIKDLITDCILNKRKSQTIFYYRYVTTLGNTSARYSNSKEDAKDILQNSFVKIFRKINNKFESEEHLIRWMKRIVINTALNHNRNKTLYNERIKYADSKIIDEGEYSESINDEQLLFYLKKLDPKYSQIINLIIVDGFSHKEAGELLKIKESSSRGRLSRAIGLLRMKMNVELVKQNDEK